MSESNITKAKPVEAGIQQINLGYNSEQDRLLLKVGLNDNSELVVWLTYRIAKKLWPLLSSEAHLPTAHSIALDALPEQAVKQFKQELQATEALQNMDFSTEYKPRTALVNDGILLAKDVKLHIVSKQITSLEMACVEGLTVRMNLTQELILALCNMLQRSANEAAWQLSAEINMPSLSLTSEAKILH